MRYWPDPALGLCVFASMLSLAAAANKCENAAGKSQITGHEVQELVSEMKAASGAQRQNLLPLIQKSLSQYRESFFASLPGLTETQKTQLWRARVKELLAGEPRKSLETTSPPSQSQNSPKTKNVPIEILWKDFVWTGDSKAFAILGHDGNVQCFGRPESGGSCHEVSNVKTLRSAFRSFVAHHEDGSVSCWGDSVDEHKIDCSSLGKPKEIFTSPYGHFLLALYEDGSTQGLEWAGEGPLGPWKDIVSVVTNNAAVVAINKKGQVFCWGQESFGGKCPEGLRGVKSVGATHGAFAAVLKDGAVICWGEKNASDKCVGAYSFSQIVSVLGSWNDWAGLRKDGRVQLRGQSFLTIHTPPKGTKIKKIYASHPGFVILHEDHSLFYYGSDTKFEWKGVESVHINDMGFLALLADGTVYSHSKYARPETPKSADDIRKIITHDRGFFLQKTDGSVLSWAMKDRDQGLIDKARIDELLQDANNAQSIREDLLLENQRVH